VVLTSNNWNQQLDALNGQSFWFVILLTALAYVFMSLARIYLGASFPSDCVLSLGPIVMVLAVYYLVGFLFTDVIKFCPACQGDNFCYIDNNPSGYQVITRKTYDFWTLNGGLGFAFILMALAIFTFISIKPVELWRKTPYFLASCLAIVLFQTSMLCPHARNGYSTLPSPQAMALSRDPF
jgi:hypothetical protein